MQLGSQFEYGGIPYRIVGLVRYAGISRVVRVFAVRIGHRYADGRIYDVTKAVSERIK